MARLIAHVESQTLVDHQTFDLIDDSGTEDIEPDRHDAARWLFAGDNIVTVVSASSRYHVATVTVEAWDSEPPPADGWADPQEATLRLDSGFVEVNPLVEGGLAADITVGEAGDYRVRAYATGRDEIVALDPPPDVELRGVERYLFQFWPDDPA